MVDLTFDDIIRRLAAFDLEDVDVVIGIQRGGMIPAALIARKMDRPLSFIPVRFRDDQNRPLGENPVPGPYQGTPLRDKAILLVDDVAVSGKTLAAAAGQLSGARVATFVMLGRADYVLFPEIKTCVNWPWNGLCRRGNDIS